MMNKEITSLLAQGYTCVTPTRRLSRYLQSRYAALQIEAGKSAWETPDILPWGAWLGRLWGDFLMPQANGQSLLASHQQQVLWQQVISTSPQAKKLLSLEAAARQAIQAWTLCHQWQLPVFPVDIYLNEDARAFQRWAKDVERRYQANGWVDEAVIATRLMEYISQVRPALNQKIFLLGFDEFTPQQRALIDTIGTKGATIRELPLINQNQYAMALGFSDSREEVKATANWVRQLLETESGKKIGIVVADLYTKHRQIENTFDDVIIPGGIISIPDRIKRPYSISQGRPLNQYPVIDTALLLLGLGNPMFSLEDIGSLLRSPYIRGACDERVKRNLFDACLRDSGEQQVSITAALQISIDNKKTESCPEVFLAALRHWQNILKECPITQSTYQWARTFTDFLKCFHWPGDRKLNSDEYQTVQAWHDVIDQFVSLGIVSSTLTYQAAYAQLVKLVSVYSYQPETPEVPIQVLGMTGAAGMQFDHLWVMGLHEEAWPAKADPNPFIPVALQREAKLPNVTAESKLMHARLMTQRLVSSSSHVILSYPKNEDERRQRPSSLIKPYLRSDKTVSIAPIEAYSTQIFDSRLYECVEDNNVPAIAKGQFVSGGANLFKDQAACPFRATARHRLSAYGLATADIGLDARDRGLILHQIMQMLWHQLGDQEQLNENDDHELDVYVKSVITTVLKQFKKKRPVTFTRQFIQLETERLRTLIMEWLAIERNRQSFRVFTCEEEHVFTFNNIKIRTRIDRVDKLDDGRFVVIDYKTGDPKLASWFDERPDEPQLPLYAVTSKGKIAAIVFASIKRGKSTFIGLSESEDILPNVKTISDTRYIKNINDWEELLMQWQVSLGKLAIAFQEGDARVDPKATTTCRYCDLHTFCRIDEIKSNTSIIGEGVQEENVD